MRSRLWPAWIAAFTEGACLSVILFLLPLYAAKTFGSHSLFATQAIVAVPALVTILASNVWGAAADLLGRSLPLVAAALGCYAATFWALSRATTLPEALAIVVIGACGYAGAAPLVRSHVTLPTRADDGGTARRGRALGMLLLAETLGLALANGLASGRYDATRGADSGMTPILLGIGTLAALGAIVVGAQLFVKQIEFVASSFGIPPLVLALVIAPLATELPEKFNSVLWVRQRKDTLAMGNISGAMVFQSCIPVAVGMWFTPWVLNEFAVASAVVAIAAGLLMQLYLRSDNVLSGRELASLGLLYAGFIVYVVAFPHGSLPVH